MLDKKRDTALRTISQKRLEFGETGQAFTLGVKVFEFGGNCLKIDPPWHAIIINGLSSVYNHYLDFAT